MTLSESNPSYRPRDPVFDGGVDKMREAVDSADDWYPVDSPEWRLLASLGEAIKRYDAEWEHLAR